MDDRDQRAAVTAIVAAILMAADRVAGKNNCDSGDFPLEDERIDYVYQAKDLIAEVVKREFD